MKKTIITISFVALIALAATAWGEEIIFEDPALEVIKNATEESRFLVSVDREGIEKQIDLFRQWIAPFIALDKAEKRESRVFNRISYIQEQYSNLPFYLGDSFHPESEPQKLKTPLRIIYREGPLQFSLAKMKEEKTEKVIEEKKLLELGIAYLEKYNFLIQSEEDRIAADYEVLTAKFNMEGVKEGMDPVEKIGQQDLVLFRDYKKRPVFNSSAFISVLPESGEVVELSLNDWTPVNSYRQVRLSPEKLKDAGIYDARQIQEKIEKLVSQSCGGAEKIVVTGAIPGYYQTDEWLYPVLGIEVTAEFKGEEEIFTEDYFEAINMGGQDDIFSKDYRQAPESIEPKE